MTRLPYPSDINDDEWTCIAPHLAQKAGAGRKRSVDIREVVNALLYLSRSGCQWRMLPHDFPPWETVNYYFRVWITNGLLEQINDCLRETIRIDLGRDEAPSVGILDSQSINTTIGGEERGFDTHKQVKGRKRHCIVDTLGLLILVTVTAASMQDSDAGQESLIDVQWKSDRLQKMYADQGYKRWLVNWVARWLPFILEIVQQPAEQQGFVVHPKRWIVERFCAWLNSYRRLSKDYERTIESSTAMVYLASIRLMVRRLHRLRTNHS